MTDMLIKQMEGKLDSWAIRWCYTISKNDAYCVYPTKSYISNIGLDGSGIHSGFDSKYVITELNSSSSEIYPPAFDAEAVLLDSFKKVFRKNPLKKSLYKLTNKTFLYNIYIKIKNRK